eukprot:1321907-Pleurochrysis_carterae.AAC.5
MVMLAVEVDDVFMVRRKTSIVYQCIHRQGMRHYFTIINAVNCIEKHKDLSRGYEQQGGKLAMATTWGWE